MVMQCQNDPYLLGGRAAALVLTSVILSKMLCHAAAAVKTPKWASTTREVLIPFTDGPLLRSLPKFDRFFG